MAFWVVVLCNVVAGYQHFRGPCYPTAMLHSTTTQKNTNFVSSYWLQVTRPSKSFCPNNATGHCIVNIVSSLPHSHPASVGRRHLSRTM